MKTAFTGPLAAELAARPRRTDRPILLVGFVEQGNLGIGYLASTLEAFGWRVLVADVESDPREILRTVEAEQPVLIGFSLIFQFYIRRYRDVILRLRAAGIDTHMTMGGHFPSLGPAATFEEAPELDSVVQYEGELTLLELADALSTGADWRTIPGVIHRHGGPPACAETRHLLRDLDDLPWPKRDYEAEDVLGHRVMPLLASRGCARTCSFCSIHTFYRTAPGKVVRTRAPAEVVAEMRWLLDERGISIFLFQDDDFPLFGRVWKRWTRELIAEMWKAGLPGRAIWKINCRADAIDEELLAEMKAAGLYLVYMGLESGDGQGLDTLDKGISVEQNLAAVATLKRLGLVFDFGFMLLDPSSSFESIRNNLGFLRTITGDGSVAAVFCRMLPYDGTPIKDRLAAEGRLRGDVCDPDYDFLDPRLDAFHAELDRMMKLSGWIHGHQALSPMLNWAWNEVAVLEGLFPRLAGMADYRRALAAITGASNAEVLDAVEELAAAHEAGRPGRDFSGALARSSERLGARMLETRNRFVAAHQAELLAALASRPALAVA
jgi:radical SAM superfamily enzyme YgiQ (UPF0313 family)